MTRFSSTGSIDIIETGIQGPAGTASRTTVTKSADATLTASEGLVLVDASGGVVIITLPDPTTVSGVDFMIIKNDSSTNTVTVSPNGSETIDGESSYLMTAQFEGATMISDGTNWYVIGIK